jgi:hypothetical protein
MNTLSLFIPFLNINVTVDDIIQVIGCQHCLGVVGKIDLVTKTDKTTGNQFNMAYIHMIEWNTYALPFMADIVNSNQPCKLYINDHEYWTVLENKYEDKKITNAPKKAKKPKRVAVNLMDDFDEESFDLVDVADVERIEGELANAYRRISELESKAAVLA